MNDEVDYAVATLDANAAVDKPMPPVAARTATDMRVVEVSEALAPAYAKASTLEMTDSEVAALTAPFPDSAVDIRPHDGLIFLSHINISDRLTSVFKPGKWSLVLRRHWVEQNIVYGEYILLIKGSYVGESIGGHPYQPNNPKVNYSDSLESTAGEALRRICGKRLSCGSQVWHKDYAEQWVAKNAEQVNGKWRKRAIAAPAPAPKPAPTPQPRPAPTPKPQVTAPKSAEPLTTAQRREKLLAALRGYEPEANAVFRENALVLETEQWTEISDFTLDRIQPANLLALIKEVKQRKRDSDQLPGAEFEGPELVETPEEAGMNEPQDDRSWERGVLPFNSPKNPAAKKGMTLKELFDNPETSKFAFGLCMNFKAESRTAANGKVYPPTEADHLFASACSVWRKAHGKE